MERILSTAIEKTKRILEESRQLIQRSKELIEHSRVRKHPTKVNISTSQNSKSLLASPDA